MANIGTAPIEPDDDDVDIGSIVKAAKIQKRWVQEIRFYEKKSDEWVERGKKILRRYKDERSPRDQRTPRFNILWSNTQTLLPALIAKNPKPDIERRFRDKDDLGRVSSQVLERAISYFVDEKLFTALRQTVIDRLLPGRGTMWVRYEPHFKDVTEDGNEEVEDEGYEITDDVESYAQKNDADREGEEEADEQVDDEVICFDYVHWQDFGHTFGRTWDEVDGVWRKVYLTREELIDRFGEEIGKAIKLDYSPHDLQDNKEAEVEKKATIYEIWCKSDKTVYWIHKDHQQGPLDQQADPLGLQDFWPCPKPLFATLANDTCIPVSDYKEYQDQANELDELTSRIGAITKAVKVAGVYDASAEGVERLLAEGIENQLVPVKQYAALSEKGGLASVMNLMPMEEILKTLLGLYEARDKVKQDLYEITGIADILRGASDPDETYGAQRIKSQFGTLRLSSSQDDVQRFARDLICIGTQIIAEHFSLDTIKKICGVQLLTQQEKMLVQMNAQQAAGVSPVAQGGPAITQGQQQHSMLPPPIPKPPLPPQLAAIDPDDLEELMAEPTWEEVYQLIRDELMLSYKIDIETDSTIKFDEQQEQASRVEFLQAAGGFLQQAMQVQNADVQPLLAKMLMFGVRGFKIGKELESSFENAIRKLERDSQNPAKQKPDPEMQKAQAQMAVEQFKAQTEEKRLQIQAQVDTNQGKVDAEVEKFKMQMQGQLEMAKAKLDSETKIAVAQIQAKASLKQAVLSKGADEINASDPAWSGADLGDGQKQPTIADLIGTVVQQLQATLGGIQQSHAGIVHAHQQLAQAVTKPKRVMRDESGNIAGIQ